MYFHVKLLKIQTEKEMEEERLAEMKIIREQEQEILDSYIAANHSGAVPKPSGLYVIEQRPGSGRLPEVGDMLRLHFSIENLNGDLLFSTEGSDPVDVEFGSEFDTKAFDEGVGYVRKGGKAKLIAPSFLAYDSVGVPQVLPPFTSLVYNIELLDILSVEQVESDRMQKAQAEESKKDQARLNEPGLIQQYLRENQYEVQPMPSGLYYIEIEKGTGPKAEQGNTVEVHYTLYNIQGRQLQSSKEFGETFKLTVGVGQVIKGWDEGLQLMHQGGKARFIIPSELAYGATQRGEDIPPYSPLVFDVEMIAVTP
jgi:peptidylprolyl isomerase